MGRHPHCHLPQDGYVHAINSSSAKPRIVTFSGLVPIGEASVIIAISSQHREEGLEAVHWSIDELKATVPIWKKEFYTDGSVWKGNAECRHGHRAGQIGSSNVGGLSAHSSNH
eukprot:TRINITY_DN362_c0_g1_i10.p1 TRINITY_DN362_c0_g1~~TRINITY_DN362_c0_g1_i10.p1  ORF type:complete len:113 (-),score=6.79 TRINITY_DN362_c0_g1_i10:209-547(-)